MQYLKRKPQPNDHLLSIDYNALTGPAFPTANCHEKQWHDGANFIPAYTILLNNVVKQFLHCIYIPILFNHFAGVDTGLWRGSVRVTVHY